ncbi:Aste57867_22516 [Aphanomyces stellatus]|uniref:Aste57867_22516 protein n=1 Tax=Aphanomyces stellatus TaxID=120398 RepID=A0A485LL53_9STRA|nr:hypothetical protein As57867_022446 [Aphanomyces stellatus]VFT99176.1 Aste57867_22516 [Aphanomyces stellatus]
MPYKMKLFQKLATNLNMSLQTESGMLTAYTARSIWMLWVKTFDVGSISAEDAKASPVPFGLFELHVDIHAVDRTTSSVHMSSVVDKFQTLKQAAGGPRLLSLVESAMHSVRHMGKYMVVEEPSVKRACQKAIECMCKMARSPFPKARQVVCRTLHHMYTTRVVQITPATMIYILCTLSANVDAHLATAAASTLVKIYRQHLRALHPAVAVDVADQFNLLHLSQWVLVHARETPLVEPLLRVVVEAIEFVESVSNRDNPACFVCDGFVSNLLNAQLVAGTPPTTVFLIDDILLNVHFCCESYLAQLQRRPVESPKRRQSRMTTRRGSTQAAVAPSVDSTIGLSRISALVSQGSNLPSSSRRHSVTRTLSTRSRTKFSMNQTTSFLIETNTSNLIRPTQYHIMRKRRDMKVLLQQHVVNILQDGLEKKKAVVELTTNSKKALGMAVQTIDRFAIFDAWLTAMQQEDALAYLLDLLDYARLHPDELPAIDGSSSHLSSILDSFRSVPSMKRSTRESMHKARESNAKSFGTRESGIMKIRETLASQINRQQHDAGGGGPTSTESREPAQSRPSMVKQHSYHRDAKKTPTGPPNSVAPLACDASPCLPPP